MRSRIFASGFYKKNGVPPPEQQQPLPERNQHFATEANPKVVVSVLVIVGVTALILGFFQLLNVIRSPFSGVENSNASLALTNTTDEELKNKDTDGDGLNDYDELYLYQTSPFLADSDSDGKTDKQEFDAGTNPNCPAGQTCSLTLATNSNSAGNVNAPANTNAATVNGTNITTDQLRKTLKEAGAPSYVVDQADDATLIKLYQNAVSSANTNGGSTNIATDDQTFVNNLQNMSAADIRSFLSQGGADPAALSQIDDASLQKLFQTAVQQQMQNQPTP